MVPAKKKPSILLVDDEPEILYSLKGLLRREYELYTAESGKEALEILRQHPIDVIMTDQRMPEMTGIELMASVKTQFPDAVRIVFTGYADIKAVIDAINNGGLFRYITKPWDPDDLLDVLRQATAAHDEHVERTQLLVDVHNYVADSHESATAISNTSNTTDPALWNRLANRAAELLPRLNQAMQDR